MAPAWSCLQAHGLLTFNQWCNRGRFVRRVVSVDICLLKQTQTPAESSRRTRCGHCDEKTLLTFIPRFDPPSSVTGWGGGQKHILQSEQTSTSKGKLNILYTLTTFYNLHNGWRWSNFLELTGTPYYRWRRGKKKKSNNYFCKSFMLKQARRYLQLALLPMTSPLETKRIDSII